MHPVLFHLGAFSLPTFGALLAAGLLATLALSERTARLVGIGAGKLWDAGLFTVVAAFLISRALLAVEHWHTFVRYPLLLLALPSLTGTGIALTLLATIGWLAGKRIPLRPALEAWTPCGLLLWGFLALGHFAEGSDPGMPTTLPWGVSLRGTPYAQQPVALLTAGTAFMLAAWTFARVRRGLPAAGLGLAGAGLAQMLVSFLRQPAPDAFWGMDALEWVGLVLLVASVALLVCRAYGWPVGRSSAARWSG